MGIVDPLNVIKTPDEMRRVREAQEAVKDHSMFVVLSDVHLDRWGVRAAAPEHGEFRPPVSVTNCCRRPEVMNKLRDLFAGFGDSPVTYVLIGNFSSVPFGVGAQPPAAFVSRGRL